MERRCIAPFRMPIEIVSKKEHSFGVIASLSLNSRYPIAIKYPCLVKTQKNTISVGIHLF